MNSITGLLIRHAVTWLGVFISAHPQAAGLNLSTSQGLLCGLVIVGCVTMLSTVGKYLHISDSFVNNVTNSEILRTAIGSLCSQEIGRAHV